MRSTVFNHRVFVAINPGVEVREYVYGEMGAARSIKTREWNYISLRYTKDQSCAVMIAKPELPPISSNTIAMSTEKIVWRVNSSTVPATIASCSAANT